MPEKPIKTDIVPLSLEKVEQISESLLAQVRKSMKIQAVLPIEDFSDIVYDFNLIDYKEGQDPHICNLFLLNISNSHIQILNICPFNSDLRQFGKKVTVSRIVILLFLLSAIDVLESTNIQFKSVWGHTNDIMFAYMENVFTKDIFVRDDDEYTPKGSNDFTIDYFKFISSRERLSQN